MHRNSTHRHLIAGLLLLAAQASVHGAEPQGIWRYWPFRAASASSSATENTSTSVAKASKAVPRELGPRTIAPANHQVALPAVERMQPLALSQDGPVIVGQFNPHVPAKIDPSAGPYPLPPGTPTADDL